MTTKTFVIYGITACSFAASSAHAQRDTIPSKMSDHDLGMMYLQKSKRQKTTGWILLGVGMVAYIGGAVAYTNSWDSWDGYSSDPGTGAAIVELVGFGMTIASVPVFINAAKNKGRAEILLRNENIMMSFNPRGIQPIPTIGIGIPICGR